MVILNSIALLVLVIWTVLFLRPDVEIIYPQGEHVLLVQSWYGDSTTEPSLEMFDDWKNGRVHLVAGESDRRKFPFNSHANDETHATFNHTEINALRALLLEYNLAALEIIRNDLARWEATLGKPAAAALLGAVESLDFETALNQLPAA